MKIYAVTYRVKDIIAWYDVMIYFSEDKEKCEEFIKDKEFTDAEINEYESEAWLSVSKVIKW